METQNDTDAGIAANTAIKNRFMKYLPIEWEGTG